MTKVGFRIYIRNQLLKVQVGLKLAVDHFTGVIFNLKAAVKLCIVIISRYNDDYLYYICKKFKQDYVMMLVKISDI